ERRAQLRQQRPTLAVREARAPAVARERGEQVLSRDDPLERDLEPAELLERRRREGVAPETGVGALLGRLPPDPQRLDAPEHCLSLRRLHRAGDLAEENDEAAAGSQHARDLRERTRPV